MSLERKELHQALLQSGKYQKASPDFPLWVEAWRAYQKSTGDQDANLNCGSCINKIKKWLER